MLATPFGQMIAPMLSGLEQQLRGMQQQQPAIQPAALGAPSASGPVEAATEAAAAAKSEQQQQQQKGGEGPALLAAEVELEAAVAAGMMQEAAEQQQQRPEAGQPAPGSVETAVPAGGDSQAAQEERLATELEVAAEFRRLMAGGGVPEHEAQALALEAVAARRQAGV